MSRIFPFLLVLVGFAIHPHDVLRADETYDVVIYGGTSAGVAAAIQARRMGKSVVIVEPTTRVGGLTSGGLGQTDIGNKAAIGGVAREFYQQVRKHYDQPSAWRWEKKAEYQSTGQSKTGANEDTMWTFEPSTALLILQTWIRDNGIVVRYNQRLDRQSGVAMTRSIPWRIVSIRMESGETFRGRMFIDASYEGDLAASANVSYTVGRESNEQYGETLNGVQTKHARSHQLVKKVDPYVLAGDPSSGLLPHIDPNGPGKEGSGDNRLQAYCFRMCLTDHPENRIPFAKPDGYEPLWYELMLRNFEAGEAGMPWINSKMPNRKTDTNNRLGFSTDFIGQNYRYPEASYAERERIVAEHRLYQQGFVWTLANHPRVPAHIREQAAKWGMCKDEFAAGNGWQRQLYIREARRIIGDYVMTQQNCQGKKTANDPVALAAYTMDSHNQQRYVDNNGHARNEGDVQVGGFSPYPISYRSIIPKRKECSNLFVPVCLSASHIAFGSIRMEPVFMVLGQSSATAACLAIDANCAVHDVNYQQLRSRLLSDKQVLQWTGPKKSPPEPGLDPKKLPGIVIDEEEAELLGFSMAGHTVRPYLGPGYRHDGNTDKGHQSATFTFQVPESGQYDVRIGYGPFSNRASNVPVKIRHARGETRVMLNQKKSDRLDRNFHSVGTFHFDSKSDYQVVVSNEETDGYVILDGIQILRQR